MLILKQARIEGDSEPKVISLGDFAINVEDIMMVYSVFDKYDCIVKNVTVIRTKQGESFTVAGEFKSVIESIEELNLV